MVDILVEFTITCFEWLIVFLLHRLIHPQEPFFNQIAEERYTHNISKRSFCLETEADATEPTTIHTATEEKDQTRPEVREEKTQSVNIESDQEEDETNQISTPTEPATTPIPPPSTTLVSKQDSEINKLIDDLTKSDDEEDEVLINYSQRKQRYKHTACKTIRPN
ncbi:hypothetical protein J1N35_043363 [Gossypium stocksii]|uniref:Uncharacterized protein n=1 Tax=Gossypium stocksii TaxID=47602 RepID=A0A9D3ZEY1_9ROSI|nr:hypothetical protein J1N35_043363 [Gossypium stocksii]